MIWAENLISSGNSTTDTRDAIERLLGIVAELKYCDDSDLDGGCDEAMKQIEEKRYVDRSYPNGMTKIVKCGIAYHVKECRGVFE